MPVFLFTDIEGSTQLWEKHTASMGAVIARHDGILQRRIEACGGMITKHLGDGVTAAFDGGNPVQCTLETQKELTAEPWGSIGELRVRMALHAGEAECRSGDYFGPVVNCTARIMAVAWGGQILLTPGVLAVSELPPQTTLLDLGQHLLKDVSKPQQLYQLVHPDLQWQAFPPPRSLSGTAIRHSVGEQGQRLAALTPAEMAVGLVGAALLPTVLGDLSPSSPALVGNLGVLGDLGADSLSEFLVEFVSRLRSAKQTGKAFSIPEIQHQLEARLMERWKTGGTVSAALRADASRLLRAVQAVEVAMDAAGAEEAEALALRMASLGTDFREFHWMVDGLREALTEVRVGQAVQLAMQRAQLDLQRQQLVKTDQLLELQQREVPTLKPTEQEELVSALLGRLKQNKVEILDLPSLSVLYASRRDLEIGSPEIYILVRSALFHGLDVRPWLRRAGSPEEAVAALVDTLARYPRPDVRLRVIGGLESLDADAATEALVQMALNDDTPEVRAQAALAASRRGRQLDTMRGLVPELPDSAAAMAAFVAVADEAGIPQELGAYPKAPVFLALAWRRWGAQREQIRRQTFRAALAGVIVSLLGGSTPLFYYLAYPDTYRQLVEETFPLPAWIFSGIIMFLLIGCVQGAASGFAIGLADAVWHDVGHWAWRWALGLSSGLALAVLFTLLSLWQVSNPEADASVFIPVYVLYGLAFGAAATVVIPHLGSRAPFGQQLTRAAVALPLTMAATVPYAFLVYPSVVLVTLAHRLTFGVGFPLALALLFGRRAGHGAAVP